MPTPAAPPHRLHAGLSVASILLVHALAILIVGLVLVSLVPKYMTFFAQYAIELPEITRNVIRLSRLLTRHWIYFGTALLAFDAAVILLLRMAEATRRLLPLWTHAGTLLALLALACVNVALCLPVVQYTRRATAGPLPAAGESLPAAGPAR